MTRLASAALLVLSGFASVARAADPEPSPPAAMPQPTETAAPPPAEGAAPGAAGPVVPAGALAEEAPLQRPADLSYGVAARLRWISVPSWMLNLFTKKNVPLSSWGTGLEFFRRKANFDLIGSLNYQNMSPPDGNWLGKGHSADIDTDYVQFQDLALWSADISFVWHTVFNEWFGMHYGAGIGVAYVHGTIWRTSNGVPRNPDGTPGTGPNACTEQNAGDITKCYPKGATPNGSGGLNLPPSVLTPGPDDQANPHRFADPNKPSVLPIVNVLIGVDFRLPQVRGWEAKIEGGFYDAFFLGGAVGYTF
ncbi:MAG TPA: hypothetical protein VKQ32_13955 [Polyangia bacterium]|nr:hypothetical protein [Polyangia bacterium]